MRDDHFKRFMGEGSPDPRPTYCITIDGGVVGWVDYDVEQREWLVPGEVNMGYALHADARGRGYATRSLQLLMHHLSMNGAAQIGTLAIDADNEWSLGVARRAGFGEPQRLRDGWLFKRPIPPITYTDGVVTIRRHTLDDAAADLAATDEEQIRWLWEPWQAEGWASMTDEQRLEHKRGNMRAHIELFETGPKWPFAIEVGGQLAGYVDCDLGNDKVPHGEANISYSSHPAHRGKGHVSRAVRLVLRFVAEHTGAREAHILVDPRNEASLRVARSVGAVEVDRADTVRHVLSLRR